MILSNDGKNKNKFKYSTTPAKALFDSDIRTQQLSPDSTKHITKSLKKLPQSLASASSNCGGNVADQVNNTGTAKKYRKSQDVKHYLRSTKINVTNRVKARTSKP